MPDILHSFVYHLMNPSFLIALLVIVCTVLIICILRDNTKLHNELAQLKKSVGDIKGNLNE